MRLNIGRAFFKERHFWRFATFGEVAELYASRTIRIIAMSIVSGFTSVYLYQTGYSLQFIIGFWALFFAFKALVGLVAGHLVARFGPKHGILISNVLYVPAMIALSALPTLGVLSLGLWGVFMAFSASIHHISYIVDFSKVKNVEHAGKEIAYMNILEKIAIGFSPIVGGVIALFFGIQTVILIAAVLFAVSVLPLFETLEPTHTHQHLHFQNFPWQLTHRSIVAHAGIGFDFVATGIIWSLFILLLIFPSSGASIYVTLGILSSVTIVATVASSYVYGVLIDSKKGGELLKMSVLASSLIHVSRYFVASPTAVVGVNIAHEAGTAGYTMAFMRGVFDTADLSGQRTTYLTICDVAMSVGSMLACLVLLVFISLLGETEGLKIFFLFAALFVLLIGASKFSLYKK
jgi:MFS family permease